MNLRQAHARDDEVRINVGRFMAAARDMPTTWENAAACYVAGRRDDLVTALRSVKPFEASDYRRSINGLKCIIAAIKAEMPKNPKRINRPSDPGVTQDEHNAWLASILTPTGWKEKYGKPLKDLSDEKLEVYLANGEGADDALAAHNEIERFLSFLSDVDAKGSTATVTATQLARAKEALHGSPRSRYAPRRRATG